MNSRRIFALWWPLAASWLLMGAEMPLFVIAVSRLAEAETHLAAYGGIVFPVALVVEAPIIMLLAASTALCRDRIAYRKLTRYMTVSAVALTALHVAIAFTPLFDFVAETLLRAPANVLEPGRLGLMIMTPWTGAIAYRRFQQGVLIRFDSSGSVIEGTALRLVANVSVLICGVLHGGISGIVVGATAISVGVVCEAVYVAWRVRAVVRERMPDVEPDRDPITLSGFLGFYVPLAMTPVLTLLIQPLGAAAMNRMPDALPSVASWSAVYGLIFMFRSFGFAYQEATVRLLAEPGGLPALRKFARWLALLTGLALLLVWLTPLARLWFGSVSGMAPQLAELSSSALGIGVVMPVFAVWIHFYQGVLMDQRRTRQITEAVMIYVAVCCVGFGVGVWTQAWPGLHGALGTFAVAGFCQLIWLARSAAAGRSAEPLTSPSAAPV